MHGGTVLNILIHSLLLIMHSHTGVVALLNMNRHTGAALLQIIHNRNAVTQLQVFEF